MFGWVASVFSGKKKEEEKKEEVKETPKEVTEQKKVASEKSESWVVISDEGAAISEPAESPVLKSETDSKAEAANEGAVVATNDQRAVAAALGLDVGVSEAEENKRVESDSRAQANRKRDSAMLKGQQRSQKRQKSVDRPAIKQPGRRDT